MYHSITFGDKNTWDDWHLVPVSRPVFAPPAVKTKIVEIPGGDGVIDLTESLTGYPVYENRTGSFEFIVVNDTYSIVEDHEEWYEVYSKIMGYLHGKKMRAVLEDDKEYYYEGRFSVNSWTSDNNYSTISIDYDVSPYKWLIRTSLDDWLWDPFSFVSGVIQSGMFKDMLITENEAEFVIQNELYGRAPVCPSFIVSTTSGEGAIVRFVNESLGIDITKTVFDGTALFPDIIFYGECIALYLRSVSGTGTVSLDFRSGRL